MICTNPTYWCVTICLFWDYISGPIKNNRPREPNRVNWKHFTQRPPTTRNCRGRLTVEGHFKISLLRWNRRHQVELAYQRYFAKCIFGRHSLREVLKKFKSGSKSFPKWIEICFHSISGTLIRYHKSRCKNNQRFLSLYIYIYGRVLSVRNVNLMCWDHISHVFCEKMIYHCIVKAQSSAWQNYIGVLIYHILCFP
jgi:hypothetical protein